MNRTHGDLPQDAYARRLIRTQLLSLSPQNAASVVGRDAEVRILFELWNSWKAGPVEHQVHLQYMAVANRNGEVESWNALTFAAKNRCGVLRWQQLPVFKEMQKRKQATLANLLLSQLLAGSLGPPTIKTKIYIQYMHFLSSKSFSANQRHPCGKDPDTFFFGCLCFFFFGHTSPINELPIETASRVLTVTIQGFSPLKMSGDIFNPSDATSKKTMVKVSMRTRNPHLHLLTSLVQKEW